MRFYSSTVFLVIKDKENCKFLSLLSKIHIKFKKYKGFIKMKIDNRKVTG